MKKIMLVVLLLIANLIAKPLNGDIDNTYENALNITTEKIIEEHEDKASEETNEELNVSSTQKENEVIVEEENNQIDIVKEPQIETKQQVKQETQATQQNTNTTTSKKQSTAETQKTEEKNNTQSTTTNKENQNTNKIDLSKYSYYEKASDGSYKAFIVDRTEINKLKELINNTINSFGYKNVKVVEDSSLSRDGTMYFTANKTNVENLVYDSEGFSIYYYAVKEYLITPSGTENYFQTRSYIKVK